MCELRLRQFCTFFICKGELQNEDYHRHGQGVSEDKLVTPRKFIEEAVKDAFTRPILTTEQAREWNPDLENQVAK